MSKKLKLYRQSGTPVDLGDRERYDNDWKAFYDKAAARAGLDMLLMQRFLRYGERALIIKHNIQVSVDIPKSEKAWKALMEKYENVPIIVAVNANNGELVGILKDVMGEG